MKPPARHESISSLAHAETKELTNPTNPAEKLTMEEAVTAYTLEGAYAEFQESEEGSLEPGKLADLAVLSQDIFSIPPDRLPETRSVLTIVGNEVVYEAEVEKESDPSDAVSEARTLSGCPCYEFEQ